MIAASAWTATLPIVTGGVALFLAVMWLLVRRVRQAVASARAELDVMLAGTPPLRIDQRANFFGLASVGAIQLRGLTVLALAHGEIVSVQVIPRRVIRIPLDELVGVDEVPSFLGKTVARPLLQLAWRVPGGEECAAWDVRDVAGWRAAIEQARPPRAART